jgi:hypothetical protein
MPLSNLPREVASTRCINGHCPRGTLDMYRNITPILAWKIGAADTLAYWVRGLPIIYEES